MNIQVKPVEGHRAILTVGDREFPAAIGKAGVTTDKKEGDNKSPIGRFSIREGYYRADKIDMPKSRLHFKEIKKTDGWCDAPEHELYNRPVPLPFEASHEKLWREDDVYDVIVPLGYNDAPPVPGRGSAIFLHVARPDYSGTEGCVALKLEDLLDLLSLIDIKSTLEIQTANM
ncbi:L,D-transpeptidase family protein [Sneathiella sp. P13V-1]|nr:L,D-transpeptidase family protein [Sneathiella sp. P13V-1]